MASKLKGEYYCIEIYRLSRDNGVNANAIKSNGIIIIRYNKPHEVPVEMRIKPAGIVKISILKSGKPTALRQ